jgi:RND family efflux transporter MFP subunit
VTREYVAVAEPRRTARLAARFTAAVSGVAVDEGDRVQKGDLLVRLDAQELKAERRSLSAEIDSARSDRDAERARVDSLQASKAYWQRELERVKRLAGRDMASRSERERTADRLNEVAGQLAAARRRVEALKAKVASLRARRDQLDARLADHRLTAPFDGTVAARRVDPGDQATPGKVLFEVHGPGRRLAFRVPQTDAGRLAPGQPVHFELDGQGRTRAVDRLHPVLDRARLMRAEVGLPGGLAVTPGRYVPVTVTLERLESAALVPTAALTESPRGSPHVFVVREGRLAARRVTVLARSGERAAVTGVAPGERVTLSTYLGWTRLAAGREVVLRQ